jgi:hypothetical protein
MILLLPAIGLSQVDKFLYMPVIATIAEFETVIASAPGTEIVNTEV